MDKKKYVNNFNKDVDKMSEFFIEKPVAPREVRFPYGPNKFANTLSGVMKKIAPKYGFINVDIISNWKMIAGDELSCNITPVKISFPISKRAEGTLYVKIKNASLSSIIAYQFPVIIDRVNSYFGYNAIKYVKIKY